MDINLAVTFLEIVARRSFAGAAEHLHVTQTAISARVKNLEVLLGQPVFVRNKSGATLTPAGEKFMPFALTLVQVWERARHQVAVPPGRHAVIAVGCEASLWDPLLVDWLVWMRTGAPHIALRTEVGPPRDLLERVSNGSLDIAIVYAPQRRPGLMIDLLIEEKLILVTTDRTLRVPTPSEYIYVDWGPEFAEQHGLAFPSLSAGDVSANLGPLAGTTCSRQAAPATSGRQPFARTWTAGAFSGYLPHLNSCTRPMPSMRSVRTCESWHRPSRD